MSHEGVVDSDVWIKCQQKLLKNRQIGNAVSNKTSWLGGKIICGKCGRTMTTIKGKTADGEVRRYFNCTGRSHHKDCTGTRATVYAESLEDMVYAEIAKKLESIKCMRSNKKKNVIPELNELRNKLKSIELAEEKIADMVSEPEASSELLETMSKRAAKLKSDKVEILSEIDELKSREVSARNVLSLSRKWKTADFEQKRGVCSILINRIIIDVDGNAEIVWSI